MRLLLTRPELDAEGSREKLAAMGHAVQSVPLIDIHYLDDVALPALAWQALLVTSGNAARALARHPESARLKKLPVLAVGDQSATRMREMGFLNVESADGDVHALAALARHRLDPASGPLLHVAGSVRAGDLVQMLGDAFECRRVVLYDVVPAAALPDRLAQALKNRDLDGILFYSPRTARIFHALAEEAGLLDALDDMAAYCLSPAVAASLPENKFRIVRVAREPKESALLALIGQDLPQAD